MEEKKKFYHLDDFIYFHGEYLLAAETFRVAVSIWLHLNTNTTVDATEGKSCKSVPAFPDSGDRANRQTLQSQYSRTTAKCPENSPELCSLGYTGILAHKMENCRKSAFRKQLREECRKLCTTPVPSPCNCSVTEDAHAYLPISSLPADRRSLSCLQITRFCLITALFIWQPRLQSITAGFSLDPETAGSIAQSGDME